MTVPSVPAVRPGPARPPLAPATGPTAEQSELEADVEVMVGALDDAPTPDHAEVYDQVHARLQDALAHTEAR